MEPQSVPSAQIVGQEFVKQYYTMLNAAPEHLHRFYSHNSSFVHGGMDGRPDDQQAVTGQMEIHKKILSLNFNNCHARIRQVDCQSSVAGSVVVQVIGELSNNGQPMRKFVQSFVLAPQSAKKYYVHVDVFRYQDVCPSTTDTDAVQAEEEYAEELTIDATSSAVQLPVEAVIESQVDDSDPMKEQHDEPTDNSAGCDVNNDDAMTNNENDVTTSEETAVTAHVIESNEYENDVVKDEDDVNATTDDTVELTVQPEPEVPAKPLSWAAMASRNASSGSTPNVTNPSSGNRQIQPMAVESKSEIYQTPKNSQWTSGDDRNVMNGRPMVNGAIGYREDNGGRRSTSSVIYPDNQQVFVGNLPQHLNDQELIDFFEQFGKVVDFRINRKMGTPSANNFGQKNFGFMVFESPDTVQKVLSERPIYLRKHRLNIEEKKPKEELAAVRMNSTRGGFSANRRGGYNRVDIRSNLSDEGRTY